MIPLIRFGVVADVQYADNDDRLAWYDPTKTRYYRNSLAQVDKAFQEWNREPNSQIGFVLQLGDVIDGINAHSKEYHDSSLLAIKRTLKQFEINPHIPTFHTVGNHELYNFTRKELADLFRESLFNRMKVNSDSIGLNGLKLLPENPTSDEMSLYYKFIPSPGLKFISLDCFDISVLGHEPSHDKYKAAEQILFQHHGCIDEAVWDTDDHLIGPNKRFQASNGAISDEQLEWLEKELKESDEKQEKVIVFGHVGLHPDSSDWNTTMWNYEEVIACFNQHPSVVAYLSGHAHNSGYANANGVHFVSFQAIIETPPETEAFATIAIFEDRIEIEGHGTEMTRVLHINSRIITTNEEIVEEVVEELTSNPIVGVEV